MYVQYIMLATGAAALSDSSWLNVLAAFFVGVISVSVEVDSMAASPSSDFLLASSTAFVAESTQQPSDRNLILRFVP